ncbi:hypothetical protein [Mangrovibacterium diazotrophicum]|uniref:Uncharacterized protein n=1 Tax=Mangrovibacterium diazotrophicum TaxID=1261403 RepID=A0A419W5X1_9BACT|nr:hypothetical protein [Mangrovibacterium diazotrophicum]RKD90844.1 hypothetical protein BC643_1188 [Mangrovibacterium diazotrophicum]
MKKYALILVAVVLVMSTSAFVVANQSSSQQQATYWFLMDESGENLTNISSQSQPSSCTERLDEPDCARQYLESQTEIVGGIRQVKSAEVDNFIDYLSKDE